MLFMRYFNPRSREGSDPTAVFLLHFPSISIHAPARGATCPAGVFGRWRPLFQSTLPRGERHRRATQNVPPQEISIHAPARGATICLIDSQLKEMISIHAPARGATSSSSYCKQSSSNFNPRSREGSDFHWTPFASSISYFNPRSREGSDKSYSTFQPEP